MFPSNAGIFQRYCKIISKLGRNRTNYGKVFKFQLYSHYFWKSRAIFSSILITWKMTLTNILMFNKKINIIFKFLSIRRVDDENGSSQKIEADAHLCWSLELFTNFVILRKIFLLAVLLIAIEIWRVHSFHIARFLDCMTLPSTAISFCSICLQMKAAVSFKIWPLWETTKGINKKPCSSAGFRN